jgi:hypothetical protein
LQVYKGTVDPNGYNNPLATTYLMIGGAGNDEMHDAEISAAAKTGAQYVPDKQVVAGRSTVSEGDGKWRASVESGEWTAATDNSYYGVGKVTVVDDSMLLFQYYRTSEGAEHDSVTLVRDHSEYIRKFK